MTLREHLEAIRDMSQIALLAEPTENAGVHRQAVAYAVAALAILDDAHRCGVYMGEPVSVRLVPDPEPSA